MEIYQCQHTSTAHKHNEGRAKDIVGDAEDEEEGPHQNYVI